MKTYRIPLTILAALLVLATGAVTASAVHYVAAGPATPISAIRASFDAHTAPSATASDPGCEGVRIEGRADDRA